MNRTKIEWTYYSWNPITGCKHGCWYCYAKKLTTRFPKNFPYGFEPHFYPERLKEPWNCKKPNKIFVCSIADLFASWTPSLWRHRVIKSIYDCPVEHTFQLLTKNPERIDVSFTNFTNPIWIGTTVTNTDEDWKNIEEIKKIDAPVRFVSFEPLLAQLPDDICLKGLEWIIIGKLTGSRKIKLDSYWVAHILQEAERHNIPVFMKNNLGYNITNQHFPEERK